MKAGEKWIVQEKCRAIQSHNSYFRIEVVYCSDKFITYKFLASNGEVTMPLSKFEEGYSCCELINEPPQEQPTQQSCEGCEHYLTTKENPLVVCNIRSCKDYSHYQPKEK